VVCKVVNSRWGNYTQYWLRDLKDEATAHYRKKGRVRMLIGAII